MNSPALPEPALSPQFSDAITCRQWLKTLPLTNVPLAHAALTAQMELLNRTPFAPLERLKINELLRDPIAFVQLEMAKKYLGKPLPLEIVQLNNWNSVVGLWAALGAAYRLSLQACLEGDSSVAAHAALITQRCLRYTGLQLVEHYRIYREIEKGVWQQAHELYALAEQRGYAMDVVRDSLNKQTDSATCAASYAQILLTNLADPYRLTPRQLSLLDRWLDKWGVRVTITATPPEDTSLSLIGVDLASSAPPVIVRDDVKLANPRYLDTDRLATTFRKRIKQLRKNEDPAALGLGEDCVQPDCEALLTVLYQHWCRVRAETQELYPPAGCGQGSGRARHGGNPLFPGRRKTLQAARRKGKAQQARNRGSAILRPHQRSDGKTAYFAAGIWPRNLADSG